MDWAMSKILCESVSFVISKTYGRAKSTENAMKMYELVSRFIRYMAYCTYTMETNVKNRLGPRGKIQGECLEYAEMRLKPENKLRAT